MKAITLADFAAMVKRMRAKQIEYFKTRKPSLVVESKRIEATVDETIAKIEAGTAGDAKASIPTPRARTLRITLEKLDAASPVPDVVPEHRGQVEFHGAEEAIEMIREGALVMISRTTLREIIAELGKGRGE